MYDQRRMGYAMKAEMPTQPLDRTASKVQLHAWGSMMAIEVGPQPTHPAALAVPTRTQLSGLPYLLPGESWPVSGHADDNGTELMFVWQVSATLGQGHRLHLLG